MVFDGLIQRFAKEAPVATMVRGLLANCLSSKELDAIFRDAAVRQYEDELLFSSVVELMHLVVTKSQKSMHAAYQTHRERLQVSVQSLYNKLNGIEPQVSRALVRQTAERMREVIDALRGRQQGCLGNYRVRILDGSHLAATEHRLAELRVVRGGPLPGQALVVLEPAIGLITDIIPCEDGHAQERSLLIELVDIIQPNDLWIADRNFCTVMLLHEIAASKAFFLVRQHAGLPWEPRGERRQVGRSSTGRVYEQTVAVPDGLGNDLLVRRITLELDEPTVDGERTIYLLTNLPAEVKAGDAADEYHSRWGIEKVFGQLTLSLNGEINTLGYPGAALLGYSIALLMYNVLSVVKTALGVAHGIDNIDAQVSTYYLADEVAGMWRGMEVAIPPAQWNRQFARIEPDDMAKQLISIARHADLRRYEKHPRKPKKPPPKRKGTQPHVSTARLLANRKR
jgi:IS4 transposase